METITISKERYIQLRKCENYIIDWEHPVTCERCGTMNPYGYICSVCGYNGNEEELTEKVNVNWINENDIIEKD